MKIIWLSQAQESIDIIYDFFACKNSRAADSIYNKIIENVEVLSSFPELGKTEPQLSEGSGRIYRSLTIMQGDYKVIYFIEDNIVYISFIWVCRQYPKYLIENIQKIEKSTFNPKK